MAKSQEERIQGLEEVVLELVNNLENLTRLTKKLTEHVLRLEGRTNDADYVKDLTV